MALAAQFPTASAIAAPVVQAVNALQVQVQPGSMTASLDATTKTVIASINTFLSGLLVFLPGGGFAFGPLALDRIEPEPGSTLRQALAYGLADAAGDETGPGATNGNGLVMAMSPPTPTQAAQPRMTSVMINGQRTQTILHPPGA